MNDNQVEHGQKNKKLTLSDKVQNDIFGNSVAIHNNYAIVGAYGKDPEGLYIREEPNNSYSGSAYIFERQSDGIWTEKQNLVSDDMVREDHFGWSVAIHNNYAIVGAYQAHIAHIFHTGAAYIFERQSDGTWTQVQKITNSDKNEWGYDHFGNSIAIHNNYAIVGAIDADPSGTYAAGSAYIFERESDGTWTETETQKLTASDKEEYDYFGKSVAIHNNYAIVGAYAEDADPVSNAGSAYIFERQSDGTWTEVQKLIASDRVRDDYFGNSVAIHNNYAIVGAYLEDPSGVVDAGAAYIFERQSDGTWTEKQTLVSNDISGGDQFGISVAIDGNYAIVGAYLEDPSGVFGAGSAYIFSNIVLPEVTKIIDITSAGGTKMQIEVTAYSGTILYTSHVTGGAGGPGSVKQGENGGTAVAISISSGTFTDETLIAIAGGSGGSGWGKLSQGDIMKSGGAAGYENGYSFGTFQVYNGVNGIMEKVES